MNSNIKMMGSLGLDSEEVETTWIYFHFHQTGSGWIVTAYCEPRKKERNENYNWKIRKTHAMMLGGTARPRRLFQVYPHIIHTHFLLCVPPLLLCIVAA